MRALLATALLAVGAALSLDHRSSPQQADGAVELQQADGGAPDLREASSASGDVKLQHVEGNASARREAVSAASGAVKLQQADGSAFKLREAGSAAGVENQLSDAFWLGAAAANEGEVVADMVDKKFHQSGTLNATLELRFEQMEQRIELIEQEREELRAAKDAAERRLKDLERKFAKMEFGTEVPASVERRIAQVEEGFANAQARRQGSQAQDPPQTAEQRSSDQTRARESFEEAQLVLEESRAMGDLRAAHSAIDRLVIPLMAKEKVYQSRRQQLEAETGRRLLEEGEGLCAGAVEGARLPKEQVIEVLDVTGQKLDRLTAGLARVAASNDTGTRFQDRLEGLRQKSALASAHMLESIVHKISVLAETQGDYDDRLFLEMLSRFLNDTRDETQQLHESNSLISKRLQEDYEKRNTEWLSMALMQALNGVTDNVEFKNHILHMDTYTLAHTTMGQEIEQACHEMERLFVSHLMPSFHGVGRMRSTLDNLTKVMPSILAGDKLAAARAMMENRTKGLLSMAYAQHIALKGVSSAIMRDAMPVVIQRLHCNFTSSASRTHFGLTMLVATAITWMAL